MEMRDTFYWGWALLIPVILSLLYGLVAQCAMMSVGACQRRSVGEWLRSALPVMALLTLWCMTNIPLPVFYILAYFGKLVRFLRQKQSRPRELLLINLAHLSTMALHLILVGILALLLDTPINELLQQPFWRIGSVTAVLTVNMAVDLLTLRWSVPIAVIRTQSKSGEVRPFLLFLWFCEVFLLLDSVLCTMNIDWKLLPLFLIVSTFLMEFYIIRFLFHIYSILKVRYLEEKHRQLELELERQKRAAEALRSKTNLDPLTGIFSRRYAMEQITRLLGEKKDFSLVFIDLDQLKMVNDQEGHSAGDRYLIRFAKGFGACLRKNDMFARIGGDEFVVLLPGCTKDAAAVRMEELRTALSREKETGSFSFGVAHVSEGVAENAEQLLRRADLAMYQDKAQRKR